MINLILFGTFFIMLLLNIPIAVSLGSSAILAMIYAHDPFTVISTNVYNGMAKFLLLAIPFFVLSGNIMAKAGISTRLVNFIDDCVGHRRGGIAIVCVIVACFFGAISGSGPATVAALGIILIPAMINRGGFSAPFASAMMATASSIAIVIPPSIAFVVYASITGVSVGDMFMGGILPGIMMGLALVVIIMLEVRKRGLTATRERASWSQRAKTFGTAFWGFLVPVIILGGIYGGIFTPTEAAAVSVVYGLFVGVFIYREVKWKDMGELLGAQAAGEGGVDKRLDVLAALLQGGGSVSDLAALEGCYAPQVAAAHDVLNLAGMAAENLWRGLLTQADWEQALRGDSLKIDVRDSEAFEVTSRMHPHLQRNPIPGFVNVPMGQLRAVLDQLPRDRVIDVSCTVAMLVVCHPGRKDRLLRLPRP